MKLSFQTFSSTYETDIIAESKNHPMSITRELSEGREITRGTFDPRTYKEDDPVNWARKRKPEWMETTGKIIFTR